MRFAHSDLVFWAWMLIPLGGFLIWWSRTRSVRLEAQLGTYAFSHLAQSLSVGARRAKILLQVLALVCFLLAWARPQMVGKGEEVKSLGIEVVFLVDISQSMLAEDMRPSRLDLAKRELKRLVDMMGSDRMGLVAFAGSAALLSPLTTDKSAIRMYIDDLSTDFVQTQGTNFERGLSEAIGAFDRGGMESLPEDGRVTRVVIIASDGEDHEPQALTQIEKLVEEGVRVFALGVGTEAGDRVPLRDDSGYLRGYLKGPDGQDVTTRFSGDFLRELAGKGRGAFYHLSYQGAEIGEIYNDLKSLEQAEFDTFIGGNYTEYYQLFLILGFIFALLDLGLHDRRRASQVWRGRFEKAA